MGYLGYCDFYRLAFACRHLQGAVTIKMVVRSVLVGPQCPRDNFGINMMSKLIVSTHGVPSYPPTIFSTIIALRLVNMRRCKLCFEHRISSIRTNFGAAFCDHCVARGPQFSPPTPLMFPNFMEDEDVDDNEEADERIHSTTGNWSRSGKPAIEFRY